MPTTELERELTRDTDEPLKGTFTEEIVRKAIKSEKARELPAFDPKVECADIVAKIVDWEADKKVWKLAISNDSAIFGLPGARGMGQMLLANAKKGTRTFVDWADITLQLPPHDFEAALLSAREQLEEISKDRRWNNRPASARKYILGGLNLCRHLLREPDANSHAFNIWNWYSVDPIKGRQR
jgi:hypothetical protein